MKLPQYNAYSVVLKQQSATNGETLTSDAIDTIGFDYMQVIVHGTTSNNATNNPATLKLQYSNDLTNYTDATAHVGDGVGGFTIANSPTATTTAPFHVFDVPLHACKGRYWRALISPLTTQTFSMVAVLSTADEAPNSVTERNIASQSIG